jgi:hypothetical protein
MRRLVPLVKQLKLNVEQMKLKPNELLKRLSANARVMLRRNVPKT